VGNSSNLQAGDRCDHHCRGALREAVKGRSKPEASRPNGVFRLKFQSFSNRHNDVGPLLLGHADARVVRGFPA